ncbi:MAG: glycerol acyltransferase [Alphaproteobacteria bacterium]|nr:MAG: glycerol acyltransferase [Alphaproteobacteria bacterium]
MQKTFFDNRLVSGALRALSGLWFRLQGWRIEGEVPAEKKFVLIAAPHTSNWDFPFMVGVALGLRQSIFWMGKHTLFTGVKGPVARWLGGIAVDRQAAQDLVEQTIAQFQNQETLIVAIAPEGTRGAVTRWKTGFYRVAVGAGVPIVPGFLDYGRKVGGVGPAIYPTGDLEADMAKIKAFYQGIQGKHPDRSPPSQEA